MPQICFTKRELEVLTCLCNAYKTSEIAGIMNITKRTVETYKRKLFKKTNTHNSVCLVLFAQNKKIKLLNIQTNNHQAVTEYRTPITDAKNDNLIPMSIRAIRVKQQQND
ncbi:MAG: hypothetical protein A2275_18595 [Bacteroidetes bacterium RIFOXYA12_FULL_35_11]|nr:MAG: hypothetical protein A2275_18595 [Bacteroidetes bacterium RIFOXYA12_FULL_35_11]OFY95375.1 MAG: hypothetical protein A2309_01645 [Bacteroidetes bacterium RIFOXYB2_FULL_35_7]OFY97504.1 MAG: hypothetical protein A2491_00420 [Bacteroidetes bacterium RIFOXYC12_FULL_35_7]